MGTNTIYSKYRKLSREGAKARLLWELNGGVGAFLEFLLNIGKLLLLLALVVGALAWAERISAEEDRAYAQVDRIRHLEEVIISCLNAKAIYIDDSLHLCNFANVWIKKGDNL